MDPNNQLASEKYTEIFMKIAFFHNLPKGGAKKVMYEQISHLSKQHEITIFTTKINNDYHFNQRNIEVREYEFSLENALSGILQRLKKDYFNFIILQNLHKRIASDIDSSSFDVAIIHPDIWTQAPFLLKFLKTKSIYYCEEWLRIAYEKQFEPKNMRIFNLLYEKLTRMIRKKIDKENARSSRCIIASSKYTSICIQKAYGLKAEIVYPGVDTKIYKKITKTKNSVLFVGSPVLENGYDLLLSIQSKLLANHINIDIVDFFTTPISDAELIKKYSEAFTTLCLSRLEPFGLVPLESTACQTPVIAINEAGYKETVVDSKTGYLIQRDPEILFKTIIKLFKNKNSQANLGINARKHVIKYFSWEKHIKELEKLL